MTSATRATGVPMASITDFRVNLVKASMRQMDFARLVGHSPCQVSRWVNGKTPIPFYAATIARLLAEGKITVADLEPPAP